MFRPRSEGPPRRLGDSPRRRGVLLFEASADIFALGLGASVRTTGSVKQWTRTLSLPFTNCRCFVLCRPSPWSASTT